MREWLYWLMSPVLYAAAEDGGGGSLLEQGGEGGEEGGDDDQGGGDGDGDDGDRGAYLAFGADGTPGDRPDWVPEQFWNAEHGLDAAQLAKSYAEARSGLNRKIEEARALDKGKAPEKFEAYLEAFKPPASSDDRDLSRFGEINADDPAVQAWARTAHRHGFSSERFNAVLADFMGELNEHLPEPVNMDQEWAKLGGEERGKKLVQAVASDLRAMVGGQDAHALTEGEYKALLAMGQRAEFVSAMSKIVARTRGDSPLHIPVGRPLDGAEVTVEAAHAAQGKRDDKGRMLYDVDPEYRRKVDAMWEKVGTGTPARSSRLPVNVSNA